MNIPSIFYFSKSTSINTQHSSQLDSLGMVLFTEDHMKLKCCENQLKSMLLVYYIIVLYRIRHKKIDAILSNAPMGDSIVADVTILVFERLPISHKSKKLDLNIFNVSWYVVNTIRRHFSYSTIFIFKKFKNMRCGRDRSGVTSATHVFEVLKMKTVCQLNCLLIVSTTCQDTLIQNI